VETIWAAAHAGHRPAQEMIDGRLQPHVEVPARAELVLAAVRDRDLGPVVEVADVAGEAAADRAAVERVHDPALVAFLESAWDQWAAEGRTWDALAYTFAGGGLPRGDEPASVDGRMGHWAFDAGTPITPGTWEAAWSSARAALAGARRVLSGQAASGAFALCRPPGHHATPDAFGGYCYLGNSAIAAQAMRDGGADRVAVLDVDYHHGNGTQAAFWDRPDVLTVSLHADPRQEYPYFTGHAQERGAGEGDGANRNHPLPWGTGFDRWSDALDDACRDVAAWGADTLVVPLGVDTHEHDPISRFLLRSDDYLRVGARIAELRLPTLFVLEGGYATDVIGTNVANVLEGFAR
jgi:acetoin utilization deacetylase AcuC-like enzyme